MRRGNFRRSGRLLYRTAAKRRAPGRRIFRRVRGIAERDATRSGEAQGASRSPHAASEPWCHRRGTAVPPLVARPRGRFRARHHPAAGRRRALGGGAPACNVPYPALLALAGAALALLPGTPSVTLDPELALALFVAPVLLDAAFDSSPRDLKQNWRAVTGLALVAVGSRSRPWRCGPVARPDMPVVRRDRARRHRRAARRRRGDRRAPAARPPHRMLVILEGESLFNDASALLIYRLAVAAAMTGTFSGWSALPMLVVVASAASCSARCSPGCHCMPRSGSRTSRPR